MLNKFVIITDSCSDLTQELIEKYSIRVIPATFSIKGKNYKNYADEREMKTHDFYEMMRAKEVAITTQISPSEYIEIFEPYLKDGYDILCIAFSSALSGTYNSSLVAREELLEKYQDRKIYCIDSLCASMGQGLLVYYAATMKYEGKSIEEIVDWLEKHKMNLAHWFTVDDIGTLKRGGRLSATKAFLASILNFKPILHVSDEGKLVPEGKVRGRKKSILEIINHVKNSIVNPENQTIFISHGDSFEEAKEIGDELIRSLKVKVIYGYIGPVIGAHSGPGTLAVFFLADKR